MSDNLVINQSTNNANDSCNKLYTDKNNTKMYDYYFIPSIPENVNIANTVGLQQNNTSNLSGISNSTVLRNGELQKDISKKELDTRLFIGPPLMSAGQSVLKNTDLSSRLKYAEDTRTKKSVNALTSYSANNFIPLVPEIEKNVQNIDHIIPTYWIRGGMSTRTVVRNSDYIKSCAMTNK